MTCRCGNQFCYQCGGKWPHKGGCPKTPQLLPTMAMHVPVARHNTGVIYNPPPKKKKKKGRSYSSGYY
jgi:hypothetical protein